MNINERAVKASGDETEFEKILTEYRPFIASCVYRTVGKRTDMHDDAMSIAIIAFEEAVMRYDPASGNFLSFAAKVIRCRLIDHLRANRPKMQVVSLDSLEWEDDVKESRRDKVQYEHICQQPQSRFDDPVRLEIEQLTAALKAYGLKFTDVAKCSPKAKKTKAACYQAAKALHEEPGLFDSFKNSGRLPVAQLEKAASVSRKTIERHRNYIVCLAEMLSGEYGYLAGYAKRAEEGETK